MSARTMDGSYGPDLTDPNQADGPTLEEQQWWEVHRDDTAGAHGAATVHRRDAGDTDNRGVAPTVKGEER